MSLNTAGITGDLLSPFTGRFADGEMEPLNPFKTGYMYLNKLSQGKGFLQAKAIDDLDQSNKPCRIDKSV